MHPELFSLGPIQVHSYGFLMATGFAVGLLHWIWLGRSHGYTRAICTDLMIWVIVSGILGARVAYVLENLTMFLADPVRILQVQQGGLVFYGGLGGAALAILYFRRRHRLALVPLVDFTLTAVPLAHAFGRVGCFLNGCCFGSVCTTGCGGVVFPRYSLAWHQQVQAGHLGAGASGSLPVHPVQLYEAGFNLLVYAVLLVVFRRQPRPGWVTATYLMLYALGRFVLEYFRGDHAVRVGLAGLSAGQLVSVPLLLAGILLGSILVLARQNR